MPVPTTVTIGLHQPPQPFRLHAERGYVPFLALPLSDTLTVTVDDPDLLTALAAAAEAAAVALRGAL